MNMKKVFLSVILSLVFAGCSTREGEKIIETEKNEKTETSATETEKNEKTENSAAENEITGEIYEERGAADSVAERNVKYPLLSYEKVYADAAQMIEAVENGHIMFYLDEVPAGYEEAKAEFLAALQEDMSVNDFNYEGKKYLASLQDAHTIMYDYENRQDMVRDCFTYKSGEIFFDGAEVSAINGESAESLIAEASKVFPNENESGREVNIEKTLRVLSFYDYLGFGSDKKMLSIELADGELVMEPSVLDYVFDEAAPISYYIKDGVFVFDLNACVTDENWKEACEVLKAQLDSGLKKVVIDIRGNGGGDSTACTGILEIMGMEPPTYAMAYRYNDYVVAQYPDFKNYAGEFVHFESEAGSNSSDVELFVLVDKDSFSSATLMGVLVQDGGFGKLVGEISSNSPSNFGDKIELKLKNTGIYFSFSWKKFLRPDKNANQRELVPDIKIEGEKALDYVLENFF